jgi:transcriptional regulator with XRE-family HTH domain
MSNKITNAQRKINIVRNINFLLEEHGETKTSFSQKTGLTRATIYKILGGKVSNAQRSTVTRISDFFGVSCETIENTDLGKAKELEETLSFDGNKNPIALPVIPATCLPNALSMPIGQLIQLFNTTHYFGEGGNFLALLIDSDMGEDFDVGTLLIVNRSPFKRNLQPSLFLDNNNTLKVRELPPEEEDNCTREVWLGVLIEEVCQ